MKKSLITIMFCLFSIQSIHAMDFVPRIGLDVVSQEYVYLDNINNTVTRDVGGGLNFGAVLVAGDFFLDLGFETANTNTLVNDDNTFAKGWRSEKSITLGYRVADKIWLTAGNNTLTYGSEIFKEDRGEMSSPSFGISLTNMQQADYLFSIGFSWKTAIKSNNITAAQFSEEGSAGNLRFAWRKKGSPHLFSWKYGSYTPDFYSTSDNNTKFSYSYLFL